MLTPFLRDILCLCFCILIHYIYRYRWKPTLPYPPGLPRWPIIGNALSIPLKYMHVFYKNLGDRLGTGIIYIEAFGQPIIVLNDVRIAKDLLEKRRFFTSTRNVFMCYASIEANVLFGALAYGNEWRHQRRAFQQYFSSRNQYRVEDRAAEFVRKSLLPNLYQAPQDVQEHVRSCTGGLSTSLTYGLPTRRHKDPLLLFSENIITGITTASAPGNYLVNIIPLLDYVPSWMPGANFKRVARQLRDGLYKMMEEPYQATQKSMDEDTLSACFVLENLERTRHTEDYHTQHKITKQVATQIYAAASETTTAAIMTFILAMLLYPDVQRKAQQELDSIIGSDRLPDFSDKPSLPYLSAILTSVDVFWNPIAPMGVPHLTTDEDVYDGYYIPKGCMIMANAYAMLHDENVFPNPTEFKPERFIKNGTIDNDVPDPENVATFGFGRRICPGSHVALAMLYIAAASILTIFDISPALDEEGNPIEVVPEFLPASLVSEPLPFPCKFTPRQGKDVESLFEEYLNAEVI
ncbi:cytochrome P450 [Macrolepiota fuliginosa MF-IS2]|uniref:Cytochrome P450 n=1 Tax=Macrolepiota fuliginosa MF-IS2 TaxID=1400762 RepID=A0A9P6BZ96_9AGAR|nr:cytochrome P450 [Macrolepiota fuliginosa MF-IS2]